MLTFYDIIPLSSIVNLNNYVSVSTRFFIIIIILNTHFSIITL